MSFVKLTQNRHPERSASQIYRVYTAPMARSRRTSAMHISPRLLGAFQPPKPPNLMVPLFASVADLGVPFSIKNPFVHPPLSYQAPNRAALETVSRPQSLGAPFAPISCGGLW